MRHEIVCDVLVIKVDVWVSDLMYSFGLSDDFVDKNQICN